MFKLKTEFQFRKLVEDIKSKIYGKPEEEVKSSDEVRSISTYISYNTINDK